MSVVLDRPPRAELAEWVRVLRDEGWTHTQVARELEISRTYAAALDTDPDLSQARARKERLYRGTCQDCGRQTGSGGAPSKVPKRCQACALEAQRQAKFWTRERVIDAIQRFAAVHGRPPFAREWLASKQFRGGEYPAATSVYRAGSQHSTSPFVSWADAIEAAGFPRPAVGRYERSAESRKAAGIRLAAWRRNRPQRWPCEEIVQAFLAWAQETGYFPTTTAWRHAGANHPNTQTVYKRFGSWGAAVAAAQAEEDRLLRLGPLQHLLADIA